jgi:hypothetical protein
MEYPEEIVSVSGSVTDGEYIYVATRRDKQYRRILTSRRRYKWFHQWRCPTSSGEAHIVHYFSTQQRAAPVPAWVPGRSEKLEPISVVYV